MQNVKKKKGFVPPIIAAGIVLVLAAAAAVFLVPQFPPIVPISPTDGDITPFKEKILPRFANEQEIIAAFKEAQEKGISQYGGRGGLVPLAATGEAAKSTDAGIGGPSPSPPSYSTTNVQVQGVDEADIVKTDGTYIYAFYKNKVIIVKAYPAENAQIAKTILLENVTPQEMFVQGNKLILFGTKYEQGPYPYAQTKIAGPLGIGASMMYPPYWNYPEAVVQVYDVSNKDPSNDGIPRLEKEFAFRGNYVSSRLITNNVYFVINTYPDYPVLAKGAAISEQSTIIPLYKEDGLEKRLGQANEIAYIPPIYAQSFVTLAGYNLDSKELIKETIVASAESVYASPDSMYLAYQHYNYGGGIIPLATITPTVSTQTGIENTTTATEDTAPINSGDISNNDDSLVHDIGCTKELKICPDGAGVGRVPPACEFAPCADGSNGTDNDDTPIVDETKDDSTAPEKKPEVAPIDYRQRTIVNKFSLNNGKVSFEGQGIVPGRLLNQFSMDEYMGNFRVATTLDEQWGDVLWRSDSTTQPQPVVQQSNSVYVLNENMEIVGRLEGLAPGEKIYSARFVGERAYLVTFRQIDPLFVIDLSQPETPRVLGKLKIPGYSDYLHPIDETHLIGVGKDTETAKSENFAWYLGMKVAIFDVSDVENPKQMHSLIIGDRGTGSFALQDHKAFLYDKEKQLLVLPIYLHEISETQKDQIQKGIGDWGSWPAYGEPVFQGAFVYRVTLENGFEERGRITHITPEADLKSGYYLDWQYQVKRSLYIDNVLYTVSDKMIKANDLGDLREIKAIPFVNIPSNFVITARVQSGGLCPEMPCGYTEIEIKKAKIKTTTHSGGDPGYLNTYENPAYGQYDDVVENLDWEVFKGLDETYGCPGCADGPIETITVSDGTTSKTIELEDGMPVEKIQAFLNSLRNYTGAYGYAYRDGFPGVVSTGVAVPETSTNIPSK